MTDIAGLPAGHQADAEADAIKEKKGGCASAYEADSDLRENENIPLPAELGPVGLKNLDHRGKTAITPQSGIR